MAKQMSFHINNSAIKYTENTENYSNTIDNSENLHLVLQINFSYNTIHAIITN